MSFMFQQSCLHSSYSLRKQLILSFVLPTFVAISVVVAIGTAVAYKAGKHVLKHSENVLKKQVISSFATSSSYVAEQMSAKVESCHAATQLIVESVRDRIVGYPEAGWEDDIYVPFFDTDSQRNNYPLKMPSPSLDWNVKPDMQEDNKFEERGSYTKNGRLFSTATAVYFFQGSCDINERDVSGSAYYENCTLEHNNVRTGGMVQPTNTSWLLFQKSGDLTPILKSIYEAQSGIVAANIFFINEGAGSVLSFPGHTLAPGSYVSEGCDWMSENNPYTKEPYATKEQIKRCHSKGSQVPAREFNPLESAWFRQCVQYHNNFYWYGPYNSPDTGVRLASVCHSVFDRKTHQLIGVVSLDLALQDLIDRLQESKLYNNMSNIVIVEDDGSVIADTLGMSMREDEMIVYETDFISKDEFTKLKLAFDFTKANWTGDEVLQAYKNNSIVTEKGGIFTAFPFSLPPAKYDPHYYPYCVIVHYIDGEIFSAINEMDEEIHDDFIDIVSMSVATGAIGALMVSAIVWLVSRFLTRPLLWIERAAWSIVNHSDHRVGGSLHSEEAQMRFGATWITPRTEINQLVVEFKSILNGFSGTGASKIAECIPAEIPNEMTWRSDFLHLYAYGDSTEKSNASPTTITQSTSKTTMERGKKAVDGKRTSGRKPLAQMESLSSDDVIFSCTHPAPRKRNVGRNVMTDKDRHNKRCKLHEQFDIYKTIVRRSPLFGWILILIAVPLMLTNAIITAIISRQIVVTLPQWIRIVKEASLNQELDSLKSSAHMKALVAEQMLQEVIRDLHIQTRMAGWLFFGGVPISGVLVDMDEGTENCKTSDPVTASCPYASSGRLICDCEWEDVREDLPCTDFNGTDTRTRQRLFWHVERTDADPVTGSRRKAASFPKYDSMPNNTLWWNTTEELPGAYVGKNASGYSTSYDRIRVSSAMAIVDVPSYNYAMALERPSHNLGTYIGFEEDGAFTGYDGCSFDFLYSSSWSSNTDNKAFEIAPELCPLGKFGYDPRCRDWYASGKRKHEKGGSPMLITAPYTFLDGRLESSATSPLVNPATGEYLGQVLADFAPTSIRNALQRVDQPVSFLIIPEYDASGGDTVIAPKQFSKERKSANILDLLFWNDTNPLNRMYFEQHDLVNMKSGGSALSQYTLDLPGEAQKRIFLAYDSVHARSYLPLNPSKFGRGLNMSEDLVYVIAIASPEHDIVRPFREVEDKVLRDHERLRNVYCHVVAVVTIVFTLFTCMITAAITRPIIILLRVMQTINSGEIKDDLPPLQGGSKEIHQIYSSFAKLIKIVRMSNTAYFSGNLDWAYGLISDALILFRNVGDKRAIGIACNNLGNILCAKFYEASISLDIQKSEDFRREFDVAMAHFKEAVEIAEKDFDMAVGELEKANLALQLADRLFNRSLFVLLTWRIGHASEEEKEAALEDLTRVREIDCDVNDFWLERKLLLSNSGVSYSRLIRRCHGVIDLYDDEDVREIWNPKDLIDDADRLLFAAWNEPQASMFEDFTPIGRLQQLECVAMRFNHLLGRKLDAARLAMRMFVEDEYMLEYTFIVAVKSLTELMRDDASCSWDARAKSSCRQDLDKMVRYCKNCHMNTRRCVVLGLEISDRLDDDPLLDQVRQHCRKLYEAHFSSDDYFGLLAQDAADGLFMNLGSKCEEKAVGRDDLEQALAFSCDTVRPILPHATQLVVDSIVSKDVVSYIILITDGFLWDPVSFAATLSQLERMNAAGKTTVHVFIVGLNVEAAEIVHGYKSISTISDLSCYMDVSSDNFDASMRMLSNMIGGSRPALTTCRQSITMEKY